MMHVSQAITLAMALMTFAAASPVAAEPLGDLALASAGQARHVIVIGKDASEAEQYAAKELSHFLREMTGADFPTVTDDTPATTHEIVLGRTNRGTLEDLPADLKPSVPEGHVLLRQGDKLLIMGNIPRATLYGVYDFLELDLGCRFLSEHVNHIPRKTSLSVTVKSRKYDPPLEWRSIMAIHSSSWAARLRLNGFNSNQVAMEKSLGGAQVVGHAWHTFDAMVPAADYFEDHPEYFSMKDGNRISAMTQLCLTNEDVFELCLDKLHGWLRRDETREDFNPDTLRWVSVTQNDWRNWCECPTCKAIDDEEGGPSGSYVRFVNRIAQALEKDFPDIAVLMFGYMYTTEPPLKTRPRHNVIVQIANSAAGVGMTHPNAKKFADKVRRWSLVTDRIYLWDYITMFGAPYADPYPTLWNHDESMRIFLKNGLKGYFGQGSQSVHAELRDLRVYMAARCAWRPETDGRKLIEEYCQLYFGPAGPAIVEYIDFTHRPPFEGKGLSPGREGGLVALQKLLKDDRFLAQADAILERAEQLADTPERKLRVANQRLGIWHRIVQKEASRIGKVMDLPLVSRFKLDPDNVGFDQNWWKLDDYADWDEIRTDDSWTKQGYDYHGAAWYVIDFDYPAGSPTESLQFYFRAIDGRCNIYLDGERIAEQKQSPQVMWNKPFFRPIDGGLAPGSHRLVVRVEKKNHAAGIWKPICIVDMTEQTPENVRVAGQRFIDVSTELKMTHFSEYYGKPGDQFKKDLYPPIRNIISRKQFVPSSSRTTPGTLRQYYGTRPSTKWFHGGIDDDDAETGRCLQLIRGAALGVQSTIKPFMVEAREAGKHYTLRARIKVKKKGDQGNALRWGLRGYNSAWQPLSSEAQTIKTADVQDGQWAVHEFPLPLPVERMLKYHYVLLYFESADNDDDTEWVRVDWHELSPK